MEASVVQHEAIGDEKEGVEENCAYFRGSQKMFVVENFLEEWTS